jgi:hypothetical protein
MMEMQTVLMMEMRSAPLTETDLAYLREMLMETRLAHLSDGRMAMQKVLMMEMRSAQLTETD